MVVLHVALTTLTALLFACLAVLLGRRRATGDARAAIDRFRMWWGAIAVLTALGPLTIVLYALDALPGWLYQTIQQIEVAAACLGLWALLCYLIYAYSGRRSSWRPLAAVYTGFAAFLVGLLNERGPPEGLFLLHGEVEAIPAVQLPPAALVAILALLIGPQIVAAAAYARLFPRADSPTQRYRIAMVSFALLGWLGTRLAGRVLQAQGGAWEYVNRLIALLAALFVLAAYFPPRSWQRRWGLAALGQEAPVPAPEPPGRGPAHA